jgi:hypothetical protein
MTFKRALLMSALVVGLAGMVCLSKEGDSPGEAMTRVAARLADSLTPEQKSKALFAFDDKERSNWNFVPLQDAQKRPTRKGLRLEEMTDEQRKSTLALLRAGTSEGGYTRATTIMSLEAVLRELEKGGAMVRNPGWYFLTLFGKPSKEGKWGWRIEGHHLSLNFTLDNRRITGSTPAFFGANPARRRDGSRTLPEAEDHARDLFASLDADQQRAALQPKQFPEIEQGKPRPNVGEAKGLPAGKMNERQRKVLWALIQSYAERMPAEVAQEELAEVKKAGLDKVHFAFAQDRDKPGKPYTYRVQGPTFVIEFLNIQPDSAGNPANHIHSSWRNLQGDFGLGSS